MGLADKIKELFSAGENNPPPGEQWGRAKAEPYQSRLILDWSPDSIRSTIRAADSGHLDSISDLWAAIARDAHVRGLMQTRTVGQVSLPYEFIGAKATQKKLLARQFERALPKTEIARLVEYALGVGVGVAQLAWREYEGIPVPCIDVWDPRWLWYDYSDPENPKWYIQTHEHGDIEIEPGDGWIIFTPFGRDRPWRYGLVNSLAVPWLLKQYAMLDRARHSEVNGSPAWVATAEGLNEEQRRTLLSDLRRMAKDARVVLPSGVSLELLESAGNTGSSAIYGETIAWADQEIAIAIAGQTVTSTGTDGFSEGDVFERILASLVTATAEALEETLNEQLIAPWLTWWFGECCTSIRYQTRPRVQLQTQAAALQALGQGLQALDAALSGHGLRVDVRRLLLDHDIPFEEGPVLPAEEDDAADGI